MWDFLNKQLAENSVLLLFLAALIGGVIGASLKLIFEVVLADRYRHRRESKAIAKKFRNPIVNSADGLRGRIANFLQTSTATWYTSSEYYRLSTYYVFCRFFAWKELLFGSLLKLRYHKSRRNRHLNRLLTCIDKAFNNRSYFLKPGHWDDAFGTAEIPKFVCAALGEICIVDDQNSEPSCISFVKFCDNYHNDASFRSWVDNLDSLLSSVANRYSNTNWDRLNLIELSLISIINMLDRKHEQSSRIPYNITKIILTNIHCPRAREIVCVDVIRKNMPIAVESFWKRMKRKLLILLGKKPFLIEIKKQYEITDADLIINIAKEEYDLQNNNDRKKMYHYIRSQSKTIVDEMEFPTHLKVHIYADERSIDPDVIPRIPTNIESASKGRVLAENVIWCST